MSFHLKHEKKQVSKIEPLNEPLQIKNELNEKSIQKNNSNSNQIVI